MNEASNLGAARYPSLAGVTVFVTAVGTTFGLLISSLLAYSISRKDYALRGVLSFYVFFTLLLLVASVTPVWFGIASLFYLPIALSLGTVFLALAFRFQRRRDLPTARHLFFASIIYLPLLLGALVLTKR